MASSSRQLQPVTSPDSLVELAYDSLRRSILAGKLKPGEHLVEARIASELEISRAPVREAMQRLNLQGLTVEKPRRGSFVREIGAGELVDIYNAEAAIEGAAMRLAVERGASLKPIETTLQALKKAAKRGDFSKTVDLELRFHEQICEASGNEYMLLIFRSLAGPIRLALGVDSATYENLEDVATEHVHLLDAMRSADANLAVNAIHEHIVSTIGPVLERLDGQAPKSR
jgi:DNA-binding GntR family transcriptional regulator